jgi:hypothetical protein
MKVLDKILKALSKFSRMLHSLPFRHPRFNSCYKLYYALKAKYMLTSRHKKAGRTVVYR